MEAIWSFEMLGTNYPAMSQKKRRLKDITSHIKENFETRTGNSMVHPHARRLCIPVHQICQHVSGH